MIKKIEFFESMLTESNFESDKWNILRDLYKKNYLEAVPSSNLKIPKIIHQIWLGSSLPEDLKTLQQTWKKFHPDWEYKLWTDNDVKNFKMQNREVFEKTKNLGAKSDILRYEILYQFGGLYVDTDFECLKPFDELHHICDFYAGLFSYDKICIMNSLMGCSPKNKILKNILDSMKMVSSFQITPEEVFNFSGPHYLTSVFFGTDKKDKQNSIIFPPTYFFPSPNSNSGKTHNEQKKFLKDESHAIHYWHISWVKKDSNILRLLKKILKFFKVDKIIKKIKRYI